MKPKMMSEMSLIIMTRLHSLAVASTGWPAADLPQKASVIRCTESNCPSPFCFFDTTFFNYIKRLNASGTFGFKIPHNYQNAI
jgi:hypothetical protein